MLGFVDNSLIVGGEFFDFGMVAGITGILKFPINYAELFEFSVKKRLLNY